MNTRRVVVGYDGSPTSQAALAFGIRSAQARGVPLLLAHAGYCARDTMAEAMTLLAPKPGALFEGARDLLASAARRTRAAHPDLVVRSTFMPGPPTAVLEQAMDGAALGVVGTRSRGVFSSHHVGPIGSYLAGHAPCPLVVVRDTAEHAPGAEAGRVVVGVDDSESSRAAISFAFDEAASRRVGLTAVFAWEVSYHHTPDATPGTVPMTQRDARRVLHDRLEHAAARQPEVDVRTQLPRGDAVGALVAASAGAALTVVGCEPAGGLRAMLQHTVSHDVLHLAHSPAALVPVAA